MEKGFTVKVRSRGGESGFLLLKSWCEGAKLSNNKWIY
jgi:hypothetical protein